MLDEHSRLNNRRDKENVSKEMEVGIQEGSNGGTTGA